MTATQMLLKAKSTLRLQGRSLKGMVKEITRPYSRQDSSAFRTGSAIKVTKKQMMPQKHREELTNRVARNGRVT